MPENHRFLRAAENDNGENSKVPPARTGQSARLTPHVMKRRPMRKTQQLSGWSIAIFRVRLSTGAFLFSKPRRATHPMRNASSRLQFAPAIFDVCRRFL